MKLSAFRRALALVCCAAMLLPCLPATSAAGTTVFSEGFESYAAGSLTKATHWASTGNNTTDLPTIVANQAHTGSQSLMLKDTKTEANNGSVQLVVPASTVISSVPAGTELILTAWYKTDGNGTFLMRLSTDNGNTDVNTYAAKGWNRLSVISTTKAANSAVRVWLVSNAANTGTVWFDDVNVAVLNEQAALDYIEEKLTIPGTPDLAAALTSSTLGLNGVNASFIPAYTTALLAARTSKRSALTRAEVQACIDQVGTGNREIFTEDFESFTPGILKTSKKWTSTGSNTTDFPTIVADQAHSGKQSLMLKDAKTETKTGSVQLVVPANTVISSVSAGTELILTSWYKTDGNGTFLMRLTTDSGNTDANTYAADGWNRLSVISTTKAASSAIRVWLVSNAANTGTVWFDDVNVTVLNEQTALEYIEEKLAIPGTPGLATAFTCSALSLNGVKDALIPAYTTALLAARNSKGSALTRAEIQVCIDQVSAGNYEIFAEDFEAFAAGELKDSEKWKSTGNNTTEFPTVVDDQAHSGKQSLMLKDTKTETKDGSVQLVSPVGAAINPEPAGTELILTSYYKTDGNGTFRLMFDINGTRNESTTRATTDWTPLSVINTTAKENDYLRVWLVSNAANTGTIWFDDIRIQRLTQDLALEYIEEKLTAGSVAASDLTPVLHSKALGLKNLDKYLDSKYIAEFKQTRDTQNTPLTYEQVQTCISSVHMVNFAATLGKTPLAIGSLGEIAIPATDLPAGVSAQWAAVSPAGGNIALSGGTATVTAIPSGSDDVYTLTLRLSTAAKSVDVDYTVSLKNAENYSSDAVERAKYQLALNSVIGVSAAGYIAPPSTGVDGVFAQWSAIKSDPGGRLVLSGGALSANNIPSGLAYDEAVVTLTLSRGSISTQMDITVILYDPTYHVLLPLPNASFEAVDGTNPVLWNSSTAVTTATRYESAEGIARTGHNSLHIADATVGHSMGGRSTLDAIASKPGYDYVVTAWAKGKADAATADRAGAAVYVEFSDGTTRTTAYGGPVSAINDSTWTQVSMRGEATDVFVNAVGYSYQATICDMYFDDFLLWEITPAGILAEIDAELTGTGNADTLYARLGSDTLSVTGLASANKARYLSDLKAQRAAAGKPLTPDQLAAAVKQINTNVTSENKAAVAAAKATVPTKITVSTLGELPTPIIDDTSVTLKWTAVSGTQNSRVRLSGNTAIVDSLPAAGKMNDSVSLKLTLTKGSASATVDVLVVLKAMSSDLSALIDAARKLDLSTWLNGQKANFVTSDLASLPTTLSDNITVRWQALDSATLQPTSALTDQGKVTRPGYGEGDAAVVLRAIMTRGSVDYAHDLYLIIPALSADEARTVITENVDFESAIPADEFTAPIGWNKRLKWADGKNEILTSYTSIVTTDVFTGKQALSLTADGTMASIQNEHIFTAREGFTYELEVMAQTLNASANPCATIRFWNVEGTVIASFSTAYASAPGACGNWKNLRVSAVAPAGAVMVTAELDGGTKAAVTYFDDVRLREYPIVSNGSFELGTAGWTTTGTVADGKLTLTEGQSATSLLRGADRGVSYYLSLNATGGKAGLRFIDKQGNTLTEYIRDMKSGLNAFCVYAPENTAGVQAILTGPMTADDVKITRAPSGTGVADGDFEHSATSFGSPWDLTNATIGANTGKTGAGLTVKAGGKAMSNVIPTIDGKSYIFTADVKGKGTMSIGLYNLGDYGTEQRSYSVSSDKDEWNTITYVMEQQPQAGRTRQIQEHEYVRISLTGEATFDNVKIYTVTKSASNPSMETVSDAIYGSFPKHWAPYGKAAAYSANQDGQATEGISGLAVELFGLGEGGVRSALVKDVKGGKAYEVTANAKGSGAKLSIEFWDQNFNKLGSESTTVNSTDWKSYSVIGTAPSGTTYATLSLGGTGTGFAVMDEVTFNPVIRSIGSNLQLFMDDWLIADSTNVKRTFHPGEKQPAMFSGSWYSFVIWNESKQRFEMFSCTSGYAGTFRTSTDGVHWSEHQLSVFDNLTHDPGFSCVSIFLDEDEPDPNKRYKGIYYAKGTEYYMLCTSPDGVHWTDQQYVLAGWDVSAVSYDAVNDEYVATYKLAQADGNQEKRVHSTAVSKDLIHWTEGVRMFNIGAQQDVGDEFLRIDSYTTGMYPLGDSYIGFNQRFSLDDADGYGGLMDSNLLFSRDLTEDWQRMYDENGIAITVMPRGPEGSFDDAQAYPSFNAITIGDETWWYFNGWTGDHGTVGVPKTPSTSVYKWRKNGFMSLDFANNASMTTEQFTLMGDKLHLNAKGALTVELLDANGAVAATAQFSGNSVDSVVTWDKNIANQLGKVVSLRFTGSNAELYSIQWEGSIFSDVATDAWHRNAVHYAVDNGIMGGYGGGKFGPDDTLSRAMVVQMLYNKVGQPKITGKHEFTDVPANQWFNNAVTWGTSNGVMGGYGGGKFGPNDSVTIEQIAVILWNYSGNPAFKAAAEGVGQHSSWAANGLAWAYEAGVLNGVPFTNATETATRAQAAQMLMNFLRR